MQPNIAVIALGGIFLAIALVKGGKIYLVGKGTSERSAMEDLRREMRSYGVKDEWTTKSP